MNRPFFLLWFSETAFDLGAALSGFALGVWVFEKTGSAEQFAWAMLAGTAPGLLLAPVAGLLADRMDRRMVIASCDLLAALLVVGMAVLVTTEALQLLHLYLFNAAGAMLNALRGPAYKATVSQIVPAERLTQANGAIELSQALLQVGAPLASGYLMASAGLVGVMSVNLVLGLAGAAAVFAALTSVPRARRARAAAGTGHAWRSALRLSFLQGLQFFHAQPPMRWLLAYVVLQESLLVLITSMITPLVLSTHSSEDLGLVMTLGAAGAVAAALGMVVLKPSRRLMVWVLATDAVLSLAVAVAGISSSILVWCVCAFVAMGAGSASGVCASALWMRKAPAGRQGSVFALIDGTHLLATCVVLVLGGVLGERLFEPAMQPGGAWSNALGPWLGTGQGRGYGLMFALCGLGCLLASLLALALPRMRRLDGQVPDGADTAEPADPDISSIGQLGHLGATDPAARRKA